MKYRIRTRLWCTKLHHILPAGRAWRYIWPMKLRPSRLEVIQRVVGWERDPISKLRVRVIDLRDGLHYKFPLCCVVRYVLAWHPWGQATRRGVVDPHGPNPHVPCGVFHRGAPPHTVDFGEACSDHG